MPSPDERGDADRTEAHATSDGGEPTETVTHRPGDVADDSAEGDSTPSDSAADESADLHGADPRTVDREFGLPGYVLLGVLFVAFVVAPLVVYLRPPQLGWRVTLIVFPLLPAIGLGLAAVWATTRP